LSVNATAPQWQDPRNNMVCLREWTQAQS